MSSDNLIDELRDLGRSVDIPEPDVDVLAATVVDRIGDDSRTGFVQALKHRWRVVVAVSAAVLLALALTPPVRAAVAGWFGVIVESGDPVEEEPVPEVDSDLTLARARELVGFAPVIPTGMGGPEGIEVSADQRVLSLGWTTSDGAVRLDEFQGEIEPGFVKRINTEIEFVTLDSSVTGLWFAEPHEVLPLDADGREQVELARSAGPTLVWPVGNVTLRLEGLTRHEAVEIARATLGTE